MADLVRKEFTIEDLEKYRILYIKLICDAAIINGVQPPILMSDASRARRELLGVLVQLLAVFESVKSNPWAAKAQEQITNVIDTNDYGNAEQVAQSLEKYCKVFFAYGVEKFANEKVM